MVDSIINGSLIFGFGLIFGFILSFPLFKRGTIKWVANGNQNDIEFDTAGEENSMGDNKLVLIVRNDLKMGKGKVAAQCSHAAVMAYDSCRKKIPELFTTWKNAGQPKIVLKIDGEEEMMDLASAARNSRLLVSVVHDAGRTQVPSGSKTVLAIGPGPNHLIDQVTGHLKLY